MGTTSRTLQPATTRSAAETAKRTIEQSGLSPSRMSEWADQNVIWLLNLEPNRVTKRVADVVEACQRVSQLTEHIKFSSFPGNKAQYVEIDSVLANLNARLSKYKWHPVVRSNLSLNCHFDVRYEFSSTSDGAAFENRAVQWLMDHIDAIHRIRRCHYLQCRKWFFAVTEHQKYCRENCRKRDAAQSPEFKKKRAEYMRTKYRPGEKERNQRGLKQANGHLSTTKKRG